MMSAGWQGRIWRKRMRKCERERERERERGREKERGKGREEESILGYQPASQPAPANIDRVLSRMRLRHCYPGLSTLLQFLIVRFPCPRPRSWLRVPPVVAYVYARARAWTRGISATRPRIIPRECGTLRAGWSRDTESIDVEISPIRE
jgi:hypothetical protein